MLPIKARTDSEDKKHLAQHLSSFYVKPDAVVQDNRDAQVWRLWHLEKEHPEKLLSDHHEKQSRAALKKKCRHGSLEAGSRRFTWLNALDIHPKSKEYSHSVQDYRMLFKTNVMNCPGCAALENSHLHRFGAMFLSDVDLWEENVLDKHALSETGVNCMKRLLFVLNAKWHIEYCPQIPDLVCILLLYLSEEEAFAAVNKIISNSKNGKRWQKEKGSAVHYLPIGRAENLVFVKTFMELVKERLPILFRNLLEVARDEEEVENLFRGWFDRLFVGLLPLRYIIRLVDCFIIEGAKVLYRVGLTLLKNSRSYLLEVCAKSKKGGMPIVDLFKDSMNALGCHEESRKVTFAPQAPFSRPQCIDTSSTTTSPLSSSSAESPSSPRVLLKKDSARTQNSLGTVEESKRQDEKHSPLMSPSSASYAFFKPLEKKLSGGISSTKRTLRKSSLAVRRPSKLFQAEPRTPPSPTNRDAKKETSKPSLEIKNSVRNDMERPNSPGTPQSISELTKRVREGSLQNAFNSHEEDIEEDWLLKEEEDELGIEEIMDETYSDSDSTCSGSSWRKESKLSISVKENTAGKASGMRKPTLQKESFSWGDLSLHAPKGSIGAQPDTLDAGTSSSPKFIKSWDPEVLSVVKGQSLADTLAINDLTVPRKRSTLDSTASEEDNENVIVLQNRFGSKRFYSENSLLRCSSVAGATMMQKVVGDGPVFHDLDSAFDNFEFKVFLGSAFGWRNINSKALCKRDEIHRKVISKDPSMVGVSKLNNMPAHFPTSFITDSIIINSVDQASRLVSWLPGNVRHLAPKLQLLYSTAKHGRSLRSLYEHSAVNNLAGSLLLVETLREDGSDGSVFGGFISDVFSYGIHSSTGDESCFLFRLSPKKSSEAWFFAGSVDFAGISGGSVTPRSRLRTFSKDSGSVNPFMARTGSWNANEFNASPRPSPRARRRSSVDSTRSEADAFRIQEAEDHVHIQTRHMSISSHSSSGITEAFLLDDHLEQEARISFVKCEFRSLRFGTTSVIYLSRDNVRVDPEDVANFSDEQLSELGLHEKLAGPGLWLGEDLMEGHTGWCNTYMNEPLCLQEDTIMDKSNKLHRYFRIANVEVFGIPRF